MDGLPYGHALAGSHAARESDPDSFELDAALLGFRQSH